MLKLFDGLRDITFASVMVRMVLSCVLGAMIGLERSSKNRTAGFRTHILVCLGAAIAAMTGMYLYLNLELPTDVSRISGQVIAGLGFIGAGAIIVTKKMSIKGLTTAAGLWTTGIVGIAVGSGFYEGGILGAGLVLLTETYFSTISEKIVKTPQYKVEIHYQEKTSLDQVLRFCKDNRMSIVSLHIKTTTDPKRSDYEAVVEVRGSMKSEDLVTRVEHMYGITSAICY